MPRGRRRSFDKATVALILLTVALAAFGAWYYFFYTEPVGGASVGGEASAKSETPYGESLEIKLTAGGSTRGSWHAATATTSQNVYTVDGVYKSQQLVTLGYSLTVTYSNVNNIKIVSLYIKAVDTADSSSYTYTLASNKALTGSSPISDSGSTTRSITQHLTDIQGSTADCTVDYYIYCQVQGTGAISGQTLTATVTETKFATLHYVRSTESSEASVTPSVSVASWWDLATSPEGLAIIALTVLIVGVAVGYKPRHRGRRR